MFQVAKYGRADKDHYSADADSDVNADNAAAADHDHNNSYGDYDDDNRLMTVWGRRQ